MDDVTRALQGDHEAAKRLTEQGVLLPCPWCGGEVIYDVIMDRILSPRKEAQP